MKPPGKKYILGISAFYHDSAACLLEDGQIVAAAQEERFSRKKHDSGFPNKSMLYCLGEAGITTDDLDCIAFYDKPWLKFERLLETYLSFAPKGLGSFLKAMPVWIKEKLWIGELIKRESGFEGPVFYPEHHQSHAASAFFPSPFERAAIITMDGVGEWATTTWGIGHENMIELSKEIRFPHSLGLLYSAFTYYTGFKVNSGEYKLMGLAPYGEPRFADTIRTEIIDIKDDGSFHLNMKYFNYCQGLTMTSRHFDRLFGGPPRKPESKITQREMDLARSIQEVTQEVVIKTASHVRKETGERNLCLAGGVALNCVANGKLLQKRVFENIWIQPSAGDAGGALGAALLIHYHHHAQPRKADNLRDSQKGSLLGPAFSTSTITSWLDSQDYPYSKPSSQDDLASLVAQHLADGKVVGWLSGRMEFGPRALGARSILGDPRNQEMQKVMNLKIKFRESFRPFAPACLAEEVGNYFDIDGTSPYMLLVAPVKADLCIKDGESTEQGLMRVNQVRSTLPAITHVDYSARIQTVDRTSNPTFRTLLEHFHRNTGCGVLINTSFNVRGEPIVCTPEDAYRCFMRTNMDILVLEGCVLQKELQPKFDDQEKWEEAYELD